MSHITLRRRTAFAPIHLLAHQPNRRRKQDRAAFTLIELLVVIGIISLLVSILLPSLSKARDLARQAVCQTRVKAQMTAIHMYASERGGQIPLGPDSPDFSGQPTNAMATNQVWMASEQFNAHGALLDAQLEAPEAFFCPSDTSADAPAELAQMRSQAAEDVYCSYIYRQLDARGPGSETASQLENLGLNAQGDRVSALLFDANSRLSMPGVPVRINHEAKVVSIGHADGHVRQVKTPNEELTVPADAGYQVKPILDAMFELADQSQLE
jgi:prepilin-type N-terminal cleavage/methylation domain-containing protein